MGKALFLGLSAGFLIAYALVSNALFGANSSTLIVPISSPFSEDTNASGFCDSPGSFFVPQGAKFVICEVWNNIPVLSNISEGISDFYELATTIFGGFFQLITFQIPEAVAASVITYIIFVPLGLANAFIIFTAIRGSS